MTTRTELGLLTRLTYKPNVGRQRALRWGLQSAPALVYDDRKRANMLVVYGATDVREANAREIAEYRRTHWGDEGNGDVLAGGVATPPFRTLGRAIEITYTTRKGTSELVDWVHPFGEGASGAWEPPTVREHVCQNPRCAANGTIFLAGGTYRVTDRGIVG